jgi:hypothetical protein
MEGPVGAVAHAPSTSAAQPIDAILSQRPARKDVDKANVSIKTPKAETQQKFIG